MNNIDLMNYWIESSNNDYEAMNVLFSGGKYTWSLFVGHLVIEKLLKVTFWDYSNEPFSIFRYTSLKMSFIWGTSSLLIIYIIKPILDKFITKIPRLVSYVLITLFTIDSFLTFSPYLVK